MRQNWRPHSVVRPTTTSTTSRHEAVITHICSTHRVELTSSWLQSIDGLKCRVHPATPPSGAEQPAAKLPQARLAAVVDTPARRKSRAGGPPGRRRRRQARQRPDSRRDARRTPTTRGAQYIRANSPCAVADQRQHGAADVGARRGDQIHVHAAVRRRDRGGGRPLECRDVGGARRRRPHRAAWCARACRAARTAAAAPVTASRVRPVASGRGPPAPGVRRSGCRRSRSAAGPRGG